MGSTTSMTTHDRQTRIVSEGGKNRASILRVWYPPGGLRNVSIESVAKGRQPFGAPCGWVGRHPDPTVILSIVFDISEGVILQIGYPHVRVRIGPMDAATAGYPIGGVHCSVGPQVLFL